MARKDVYVCIAATLTGLAVLLAGCKDQAASTPQGQRGSEAASEDHSGHDHAGHDHAMPEHKPATEGAEAIAQKTCPVGGEPIDPAVFVDHDGRRVYFCCAMCIDKFKKEPAKYLQVLDEALKPHG